jgi:hypothetical protein
MDALRTGDGTVASLQGGPEKDYWGDEQLKKRRGMCRIGLLNPTGWTVRGGSKKDEDLLEYLKMGQYDIAAFPEVNVHWSRVAPYNRLEERTLGWFETMHRSLAWNMQDKGKLRSLFGGTALLSMDDAANRVMASGRDPTKLGRWSWTKYRGKNGIVLRVVCAYRPCVPASGSGATTVYAQQLQYFADTDRDVCPRSAFLIDLRRDIAQWMESGEQVMVCLDANEDNRSGEVAKTFKSLGLREVLFERHGFQAPATTDKGSLPIDGIWASRTLVIERGGYLPHGAAIPTTNHRGLWVDISHVVAYGHSLPPIIRASGRRLKLQDPRIVRRFLQKYKSLLRYYGLPERAYALERRRTYPMTDEMCKEYEDIDKLRMKCIALADKYCRKMYMGGILFSPKVNQARKQIEFWHLVTRKILGLKVSSKLIHRIGKAAGLTKMVIRDVTLEMAEKKEDDAYKHYQGLRKKDDELRGTFFDDLAKAKAEAGDLKKESVLKHVTGLCGHCRRIFTKFTRHILLKRRGILTQRGCTRRSKRIVIVDGRLSREQFAGSSSLIRWAVRKLIVLFHLFGLVVNSF